MVTREGNLEGDTRSWERTLAGSTVSICRQKQVISSGSEDTNITYRITIPAEAGGIRNVTLRYNDEAEWTANLDSTGVGENDQVLITVPSGTYYERLPISCGDDEIFVYLPGPRVEKTCRDAINGDERAAKSLVQMFASPVRLLFVCGVGLDAESIASLISILADADVHAESRLHTYRFALVRGALISPTGFSIDSKQGLETFLEGIAAAGTNGPMTVIDAIIHILATSHSSVEETIQLLQRLGYDADTVLFQDSGRLLCSFLAKDIITADLRAARGRAIKYNWQTGGHYEQRKTEAESSSYETRAEAWRELLCAAARKSIDEFAYVLANALYWSGEVSRSDARTQELLFDASETVAAAQDIRKIAARAAFNRELSAGHRLRSQHCFEMAHQHFKHARELASKHTFLPEGQPVYNAGIVRGHALSSDGNHEQAVHILDQTIEQLADYDLNPDTHAHWIRHLEAQKRETQAKQTTEYDEHERAAFLEVARAATRHSNSNGRYIVSNGNFGRPRGEHHQPQVRMSNHPTHRKQMTRGQAVTAHPSLSVTNHLTSNRLSHKERNRHQPRLKRHHPRRLLPGPLSPRTSEQTWRNTHTMLVSPRLTPMSWGASGIRSPLTSGTLMKKTMTLMTRIFFRQGRKNLLCQR